MLPAFSKIVYAHEAIEQLGFARLYSFPTIKSCSLVCKAWLPRCRYHLYRIVRIGPRRVNGIEKERMPYFLRKFDSAFCHTFKQPQIKCCVQGLTLESHVRDVSYAPSRLAPTPTLHELPKGRAVIRPSTSSIDLPFQPLTFIRAHWKFIESLVEEHDGMSDFKFFERILDRTQTLDHLVVEGYWQFHMRRDILRTIAVHAPGLKTLCLSEFRWFPSFSHLVLEDIFDEWMVAFVSLNIPPLKLDRLCLQKFSSKGTNLIQMVVLPSPCLDLRALRYLAMPAKDLCTAFIGGRFADLGKELIHLTITDLNTSNFRLRSDTFPKLRELQIFVKEESPLLHFIQDLTKHWFPTSTSLDLHINFEEKGGNKDSTLQEPGQLDNILTDMLEELSASVVDLALCILIRKMSRLYENTKNAFGFYCSMDFIQAAGTSQMQRDFMRKAFPQSFATGCLHWRERRSLEWWFE
ncbi:hypothetical protein F5878DRAFT_626880 [Lentinula raphanica]|uniref:Uncharacterized protein n=1 Tax=Lentinula raphanica TaxID=153919 RepID=A0AA38UAP3_9AGAR|nr:hypothetical protein F5878DRAFT_626880 [Lentinula raphanica]